METVKKKSSIMIPSFSKYFPTQWDFQKKSIPFLYIYPHDPQSTRPSWCVMPSHSSSWHSCKQKMIQRVLDWSLLPLKEDMHGFSCLSSQPTSHVFLAMWLFRISMWQWGSLNLFFFFCQKVQQQLILTCCYGLSMHSFIFQNIVGDKIKLMPIVFVQRRKHV